MSNEKDVWRIKTIIFGIMASFILISLIIGNFLKITETEPLYQLVYASLGFFFLILATLSYNHAKNEVIKDVKNSS